jgi:antirestriction protein ArdC
MKSTLSAERVGKADAQQNDIYQRVTDIIIQKLSQGDIPWKQPWGSSYYVPRNYMTMRPYKGFNAMLLGFAYEKPYYLTFHQVKELGGKVIKGSQSLPVVYYDKIYRMSDSGQRITADLARSLPKGTVEIIPFLKYYNVFNISQVEGVKFTVPTLVEEENLVIESCERIVANMPLRPEIRHVGNEACYSPVYDKVLMPPMSVFHTSENYYQVLFHELIHSTGHQKRLNRKEIVVPTNFGSEMYSKEELVAELGACFLMSRAGSLQEFNTIQSAAYIQGWIKRLENDKRLILEASGKASRAADFIINEEGE